MVKYKYYYKGIANDMKMNKKIINLLASAICISSIVGVQPTVLAVTEDMTDKSSDLSVSGTAEIIASGECGAYGDNLMYKLNSDGVLTISGQGEMADWFTNTVPWKDYKNSGEITRVIIHEGVTSVSTKAFVSCESLEYAFIPSSMKDIDGFTACSSLKSINLPEGLETIGIQAFCDCDSLKTVIIPSSVTTVGRDAFEECENLKSIILPEKLTSIEESAFSSSGIKTIEMPAGVTTISRSAFNSSFIESIVLPNNIVKIDEMAFRNCKNLKKIFIQNPQCEIDDSFGTICSNLAFENAYRQFDGIIYGYENSTAHAYAQKYEYPFSAFIYGDANSDGKLTAGDAAFIAKNLAEQKGHTLPAYADFTGDGKVTAYDAAMIAKYLAEQSLKN
jgi:cell surface protein